MYYSCLQHASYKIFMQTLIFSKYLDNIILEASIIEDNYMVGHLSRDITKLVCTLHQPEKKLVFVALTPHKTIVSRGNK